MASSDIRAEEVFVVSRILGMCFLTTHNCSMDFSRPVHWVDGKELDCTDRHGKLLRSTDQVTREVVIFRKT